MTIKACVLVSFLSCCSVANAFNYLQGEEREKLSEAESLIEALEKGDASLDFRVRYADIEQVLGLKTKGAQAATLRTRLSYATAQYNFMSAYIQFDHISAIPDDHNYNSGSNRELDDALVLDPKGAEINQAWLAYDVANTLVKYGRQTLELDNGRFLGSESWNQNETAFNGLSVSNQSLNALRIRLGLLNEQYTSYEKHTPLSANDMSARYINVEYGGVIHSLLSVYHYSIDNKSDSDVWDTNTQGIRFAGHVKNEPAIEYAFEYASQSDSGQNPANYSANYYLMELGVTYSGVRVFAGKEVLGADGSSFFVSPLAKLHSFQGWTGQFENGGLGNIAGGIEDSYYSLGYLYDEDTRAIANYHEFESNDNAQGFGSLGREWGVELSKSWDGFALSARYAEYSPSNFGVESKALWLSAEASF